MISQIACVKCNGQVLKRDGLDGEEKVCLNCGHNQLPNIISTDALSKDSEDHQRRNRQWWSNAYNKVGLGKSIRRTSKLEYERAKRSRTSKVTQQTINTWNNIKNELEAL